MGVAGRKENNNTAVKVNFVFRKCCHLPFEQGRSMENGSLAYASTYVYIHIHIIIPHMLKKVVSHNG
jgi:hypothetical protein